MIRFDPSLVGRALAVTIITACGAPPAPAEAPSPVLREVDYAALRAEPLAGPFAQPCEAAARLLQDETAPCEALVEVPSGDDDQDRPYASIEERLARPAPPFLEAGSLRAAYAYGLDGATCALVVRTSRGWFVDAASAVECGNDGSARVSAETTIEVAPLGPGGAPRLVARVERSDHHMLDGGRTEGSLRVCSASSNRVACAHIPTSSLWYAAAEDDCDEDGECGDLVEPIGGWTAPVELQANDLVVVGDDPREGDAPAVGAFDHAPAPGTFRIEWP